MPKQRGTPVAPIAHVVQLAWRYPLEPSSIRHDLVPSLHRRVWPHVHSKELQARVSAAAWRCATRGGARRGGAARDRRFLGFGGYWRPLTHQRQPVTRQRRRASLSNHRGQACRGAATRYEQARDRLVRGVLTPRTPCPPQGLQATTARHCHRRNSTTLATGSRTLIAKRSCFWGVF